VGVRAVVLDVGETLVDETRIWHGWADWLGVPRGTFVATLGGLIERGSRDWGLFELFRPGLDVAGARRERAALGHAVGIVAEDVYPDAVPAIRALAATGLRVGIAGNQPASVEAVLHDLELPVELVAASERWGVAKPDPAFFRRIAEELELPPADIAYVGDRVDNDVRPAAAAGMTAIHIRRGPWAFLQVGRGAAPEAAATIDSLAELPAVVGSLVGGPRG
jgi:HAD superfamily hydrolase (TIGR01662 family)